MPPAPNELSGSQWVTRFPDGATTSALAGDFRPGCEAFIAAMTGVVISSTRRPADLPHWSTDRHLATATGH